MGAVYLAERSDGAFSKQVAVKLLSLSLAHARERFHRERELLARLEHPNIARLSTAERRPRLALSRHGVCRGRADRSLLRRARSPDRRSARASAAGVRRRRPRPPAARSSTATSSRRTSSSPRRHGEAPGLRHCAVLDLDGHATEFRAATPAFSSPEQLHGGAVTTASDVYAIGVLGYVLCTGGWPYPPPTPARSRPGRCCCRTRFPRAGSPAFTRRALASCAATSRTSSPRRSPRIRTAATRRPST